MNNPNKPPRPWLSSYPEGVPADLNTPPSTLLTLLNDSLARYAERDAALFLQHPVRFADIDTQSRALAAWLQSRGLKPGGRVAVMMPNLPQYLVAIAAILRAGGVVVNVNPLYTARELEHQLKDSGAQAIIILENFAHTLAEVVHKTEVRDVVLAAMGDMLPWWRQQLVNVVVRHVRKMVPAFELPSSAPHSVTRFNEAVAQGRGLNLTDPHTTPDDIAFLQYTGGTTGVSKGAVLLHRNVAANIEQTAAWFEPALARHGQQQLTSVCALPLYHIFALTVSYFLGARFGMRLILIPNPRDLPALISALRGHKLHVFPAVNTLYNALVHEPSFAQLDFSQLMVSNGGGMAVQQATAEKWLKITGCPIAEGYGLSETSPVVTANRLDLHEFTGTIGVPITSTEVVIRDDEGQDLPIGEAGEICIRGPQVMAGYWRRPDETAKVMTPDGFFKSGDVGVMDERGYLRIVDRKKDMILVSGFNVYPTEIEQVVSLHPDVLECAAVGVPDERSGEAVKLFVVRRQAELTEEDLARYCRDNFTGYKRPKHIEFRDELPKSNVGKILRRELRR